MLDSGVQDFSQRIYFSEKQNKDFPLCDLVQRRTVYKDSAEIEQRKLGKFFGK